MDFFSVVLADFSAQTRYPQLILVPWWKLWRRCGAQKVQLEEMGLYYTLLIMSSFPLPYYPGSGCPALKQFALGQDTAAY